MVTATQTLTASSSSSNNSTPNILKLRAAAQADHPIDNRTSRLRAPIQVTDLFARRGIDGEDVTPAVGHEFPAGTLDLGAKLRAEETGQEPIDEEFWTQLAALVSHRGVVFVRRQSSLTEALMPKLANRISHFSGRPSASKLHIHPLSKDFNEAGEYIGGEKIDSQPDAEGRQISFKYEKSNLASAGWHTDISFEPIPSDYAMLQLRTLPKVGGDTMWSSMYSAYDGLSPAMQRFLEGLTAVHDAEEFREQSQKFGFPLYTKERGHPDNVGSKLHATHPVVRTNPVTGFKALYVNKSFTKRIVELSPDESDALLAYLFRHIAENFNFQVRFRWSPDDLAIWDNRSTNHSGIFDFGKQRRNGDRCCSLGEKPLLDPNSQSREAALRASGDY